jgi:aliphatic nitrilase
VTGGSGGSAVAKKPSERLVHGAIIGEGFRDLRTERLYSGRSSPAGFRAASQAPLRRELFYAAIDTRACAEPKQFHDVIGCYNCFDVFKLTVDRTSRRPVVEWRDAPETRPAQGEGSSGPI